MTDYADNISGGTQAVSRVGVRETKNSLLHPRGAVGVVTRTPTGKENHFLVRFPDGFEFSLQYDLLERLKHRALAESKLPERPDYDAANRFLIRARREMTYQAHAP